MGSILSKIISSSRPSIILDTNRAPTTSSTQKDPASYTFQFLSSASINSASLLDECNRVFLSDFGPGHRIDPPLPSGLLVLAACEGGNTAAGVVTLHHYARTCAWELGTVSAAAPHKHRDIMRFLLAEAPAAIRCWHNNKKDARRPSVAWLVKRVKQTNATLIATMESMGFEAPQHFMVGVLSDEGYVPFDPVDEMLMKRAVLF